MGSDVPELLCLPAALLAALLAVLAFNMRHARQPLAAPG